MTKSTLYLEDPVHQALPLKSAKTRQYMSGLVGDALKVSLQEGVEGIQSW